MPDERNGRNLYTDQTIFLNAPLGGKVIKAIGMADLIVDHDPVVYADEKSDTPIIPLKLPNKEMILRRQWREGV
ncbi:hypothetical protein [Rhizobium gallicum]|uniref:hypothetical protein n=1 Tax=Rhizobium gallicum TaxID=56730 RepID=UPI001EF97856|nr:hypothetical protein [Rhizobium gallicum]ULJ74415.1 hypothetical protein L2W42_21280 [Rhizobium gallicum]